MKYEDVEKCVHKKNSVCLHTATVQQYRLKDKIVINVIENLTQTRGKN